MAEKEDAIEELFTPSTLTREFDEQLTDSLSAKELGNNCFREKEYDLAIENYSKAISICPQNDENKENLV